jgi:glycosyltransferase involved in cell wall biosynthesis
LRKILHVIDSLDAGGAERLVVDVINGLSNFEHHIAILNGPETLRDELPQTCFFLNLGRKTNKEIFRHARALRRYIQIQKIELVHSHLFFSSVISRLATPKSVPLINTIHIISSLDNYTKSRLAFFLDKLTYRKHHHIIAVSRAVLDDFDKWIGIKGKSTVLYNFVRNEFFIDQPKFEINVNPLRLVAVGNLRYQKNYLYLIEAFKRELTNVTLDIYGKGIMQEELQALITENNLPIKLLGSQKELHKILPSYDAFVMCSFFEGQPLSLLEATACGLPAILSDIPVLREVTGDHALYFDLSDPSDFVRKVQKVQSGEIDVLKNVKPAFERIYTFARKEIYFENLISLYTQNLNHKEKNIA